MAKRKTNNRQLEPDPTLPRGGKKFVQCDIHWDQVPKIEKRIKVKGGSVASTIRDGLDELFKDENE